MKVLIWSQHFWPENFHINAVARSLHEQGIEVTVLTGKPNYPDGEIFPGYTSAGIHNEQYAGIEIVRIPLKARGRKRSAKNLALNYLSFIFSGYFFAPYALRGKKFDIIFIYASSPLLQALPAIFIGWLKRATTVLWVQDLWPEALQSTGYIKNRFILKIVRAAVRFIYKYSDLILIQSEAFRHSVESHVKNKSKIHFFPNSAHDIIENTQNTSPYINYAADIAQSFSIIFAGNIGTAQNCETIIKAANLLREHKAIQFYLVGSGSMVESIRKMIIELKCDNVTMTGQIPPEFMNSIYSAASALLLTLANDPALAATIPSKLQSYLAAGKPIIVCSDGESASVLTKAKAGFTCPAGDANTLAKAVLELYALEPAERVILGENGRSYFLKHFNIAKRILELADHFSAVA